MGLLANIPAKESLKASLLADLNLPAASPVDGLLKMSVSISNYTALSDQGLSLGPTWVSTFQPVAYSALLACVPLCTQVQLALNMELALVSGWAAAGSISPIMLGPTTVTLGIGLLAPALTTLF